MRNLLRLQHAPALAGSFGAVENLCLPAHSATSLGVDALYVSFALYLSFALLIMGKQCA